ncbi:hypothetical protein [Streptomyces sp. UNOC14_S4]|uniref:hypothetical protein n=1 Tax=Streptomyces sp. UNOC14_S4 TaxID=2872340 RepID=UPI001E5BF2F8|nr:hypothetical protein [Streptomyces sp. UNOC14_S4]MCC3766674.1 hypothetical protein [Streptomyces sp. UNOC14_S4]
MPRKKKDDRQRSTGDQGKAKGTGPGQHRGRDLGMHAQKEPEEGPRERTPDTRYWHDEYRGGRKEHRA